MTLLFTRADDSHAALVYASLTAWITGLEILAPYLLVLAVLRQSQRYSLRINNARSHYFVICIQLIDWLW